MGEVRLVMDDWKGYSPEDQCFSSISSKNSNSLCSNCPTHKSPTHLSHECNIPISPLCSNSHFINFHVMNIDVQPVLVLPHSTDNCTPVLASLCIPVGTTAAVMNKFATCSDVLGCQVGGIWRYGKTDHFFGDDSACNHVRFK